MTVKKIIENAKAVEEAAKELGQTYEESADLLHGFTDNLTEVKNLYDNGSGGLGKSMISFGITLVLIPEPTCISDVIGAGMIGTGFLYNKLFPPPIYVNDIFKTIEAQVRSIKDTGESLQNNYNVPLNLGDINLSLD